jgi:tight adherence protein C
MRMTEYVVYIAVFVLLLGAVSLIVWGTKKRDSKEQVLASLDRLDSYDPAAYRRAELSRPASERLLLPAVMRLSAVARAITPTTRIKKLEQKIETAGRPWNLDVNTLLVLKFVSLAVGLIVLIVLASLQLLPWIWFIVLAVAVVLLTYYLPDLVLLQALDTRKKQITRALPDFLDLLTMTVEAGLGLDSALAKIAERLRGPLKEEILITLQQIRMGKARPVALREFSERCKVEDLTNFVSAVIQSQQLGIALGQVLRIQAEQIRTIHRQRIEERAQKAPVKLLVPLILCIFPGMFVVIVGPAVIQIYRAFLG